MNKIILHPGDKISILYTVDKDGDGVPLHEEIFRKTSDEKQILTVTVSATSMRFMAGWQVDFTQNTVRPTRFTQIQPWQTRTETETQTKLILIRW